VYTPAEINQLRAAVLDCRGDGPGDLLSRPGLDQVVTDGRLVELARQILGTPDVVYYGDSSMSVQPIKPSYHKDNTDRYDGNAPDWTTGRYSQIRFGIYLQDHTRYSGGLNIRDGSHNVPDPTTGRTIYLRTGVGDVAVWTLRTTHSADGVLLRAPWRWWKADPGPADLKRVPARMRAPRHAERMGLFAAMGADDHHAARYVNYLKTRPYAVRSWRSRRYSTDAVTRAEKVRLRVWDVAAEIDGDESVGQNEKWEPTPY
jgi:hypothetical protein